MADSFHYQTDTYTTLSATMTWEVIRDAGIFLNDVVANGWELLDYSGKDRLRTAYAEFISHNLNYDPIQELEDNQNECLYLYAEQPGGINPDLARSVYIRWSDMDSEDNENYFFLTTTAFNGGIAYADIRFGTWLGGAYEQVFYEGAPGFNAPCTDELAVPQTIEDPMDPQENIHDVPWNYREQAGWEGETIINEIIGPNPGANTTSHFFGGVENGAPYFYCVLDDGGGNFTHFGLGRLPKIGTWTGGMFAVGTWWNTGPTFIDKPTSQAHNRMFDGNLSFYGPAQPSLGVLYYRRDLIAFDPNPASDTWPYKYKFGDQTTTLQARGGCVGGVNAALLADSMSTFNTRSALLPSYITTGTPDILGVVTTSIVGIAPAFRSVKMQYLNEGETLTENGKTWKVFPVKSKRPENKPFGSFSEDYGWAYRSA